MASTVWTKVWGDIVVNTGGYPVVNTYADLPDPLSNNDKIYVVKTATGTFPFNRKPAGLYHSNGVSWDYMSVYPDIVKDGNFGIQNSIDGTKVMKFDASGITTGTTSTVKISSYNQDMTNPIVDTEKFSIFNPNPAYEEGKVFYDNTKHALSYYNNESDVTVTLGQEHLIPVRNETGATIPNGAVVYPSGFGSGQILVGLAIASDKEKCRLIGVTTHEIPNGENGYVTKFGEVGSLNTTGYVSGDILYLSATVAGSLTKVQPTTSNYITRVGAIKIVDAVNGSIVVDSQTSGQTVEATEDNGWSKTNLPTLAFTDVNRTLTITPTLTNFCFYQYGDKYCKTTDSIQLPDTEGMFAIYYNLGTLAYVLNPTSAQVAVLIQNNPIVAYVYWNAVDNKAEYVGYELHQIGMDCETHRYLHFAFGARYLNGLAPNTISADGSGALNASAQFGIDAGAIADEDIYLSTPAIASTTGLPIAYLAGTSTNPVLRLSTNAGFSVLTTGTGRIAYNQLNGSNYQLTEVPNGNFVLYHIISINENNAGKRVFAFMGSNQYTTIGNARAGALTEITTLRAVGILPQEVKAIATFIYETKDVYTNAVKGIIRTISTGVNYVDWRTTYLNGSSGGSSGGSTGSTVFTDDTFRVVNNLDFTKQLKIDASGITTGQTRTLTIPDRNLSLKDPIFDSMKVVGLLEYADNATAITAGLVVGAFYRTGDLLKIVH